MQFSSARWSFSGSGSRSDARTNGPPWNVVKTGETVPSRVHWQTIDHDWKLVKEQLPDNTSARTEEERTVLDEYIRAAQWRMQHSTRDFWKPRVHHD